MQKYISIIVTVLDKSNSNSVVFVSSDLMECLFHIMKQYQQFTVSHKLTATYANMNPDSNTFSFSGSNFAFHATITEIPPI